MFCHKVSLLPPLPVVLKNVMSLVRYFVHKINEFVYNSIYIYIKKNDQICLYIHLNIKRHTHKYKAKFKISFHENKKK